MLSEILAKEFVEMMILGNEQHKESLSESASYTNNGPQFSRSDSIHTSINSSFSKKLGYLVSKKRVVNYEHIRVYDHSTKHLYVLTRDHTYNNLLKRDKPNKQPHFLETYALSNRDLKKVNELPGQIVMDLEQEKSVLPTENEYLKRKYLSEFIFGLEVEVVVIVTYSVYKNNIFRIKAIVPSANLKEDVLSEVDWTKYSVNYKSVEKDFTSDSKAKQLQDDVDKQKTEIKQMLKLKPNVKSND
ncbi:DUF5986 family protein [Paenibacillus sp. SI92]